jgi:hypothetical protein
MVPHSPYRENRNGRNLSLSRSYFITLSRQIKAKTSVLIVFADPLARTGPSLLRGHARGRPRFLPAANSVWLTDHVPPGYLSGWPG